MTTIRVYNLYYYGMFIGFFTGIIFVIIGLASFEPVFLILGVVFSIIFYKFINKNNTYSLTLDKDTLKETQGKEIKQITFKELELFDCVIIRNFDTTFLTPVFHFILEDNSKSVYKLMNQASLYDIVQWQKNNYPNAKATDNVTKVLGWARNNQWFFRSH